MNLLIVCLQWKAGWFLNIKHTACKRGSGADSLYNWGHLPCLWGLLCSRRPFRRRPAFFSPASSACRSFLQLPFWVPFPSNCFHQKNCPFQIVPKVRFNQVKTKNPLTILKSHVAINRQFGRDAPSNPIQCVSIHWSTPVSHVMLILSETNPIICAVSEPNTEKYRGGFYLGFCSLHSRGKSQGFPLYPILLTQGWKWDDYRESGFIRARCAYRALAVVARKTEELKALVADLCVQMRVWGLDPCAARVGERAPSFVKSSKEGKKQAEVLAEPDPASSRLGCFLQQLRFVWDAPISCPAPLCFSLA